MEFLRRGNRFWRWLRGRRMLLRSESGGVLRFALIRTMLRRLPARFERFPEARGSCKGWARRHGLRRVIMIESTNFGNLCGLSRRRVQRDCGGDFLER